MRAASSRLLAGGTALIVVAADHEGGCVDAAENGDAGPGRDGSDLPEQAQRMRTRPPRFAIWRQQELGDIAGMPWNRADSTSRRKQHESVHAGGMTDRQLLGDRAAVGVSDDIRFLDAERIKDPCSGIRQHGHRVRNHRSFARAHPGRVKCNNSSVLKRVGEIRPALHRARHAVEQQHRITGSGGPRRNA